MKTTLTTLVATFSLSGCLVSERPLFPSGDWQAQTPIAQGYYLKASIGRANGELVFKTEPVFIQKERDGYEYHYFDRTMHAEHTRFQIFGIPGGTVMTSQASISKAGDLWLYNRVDLLEDGIFARQPQQCSGPYAELSQAYRDEYLRESVISKITTQGCFFTTAAHLRAVANTAAAWHQELREYHRPVAESELFTWYTSKSRPKVVTDCSNPAQDQNFDPAFGQRPAFDGNRLLVLSTTKTPGTYRQNALAVEVSNGRYAEWAQYAPFDARTALIDCTPERLIRVDALLPPTSVYPSAVLAQDSDCRRAAAGACGTLDEMIARHRSGHAVILLQGHDVVRFPPTGTAMMYGDRLTVIGARGPSERLVVLTTDKKGDTRVAQQ